MLAYTRPATVCWCCLTVRRVFTGTASTGAPGIASSASTTISESGPGNTGAFGTGIRVVPV